MEVLKNLMNNATNALFGIITNNDLFTNQFF